MSLATRVDTPFELYEIRVLGADDSTLEKINAEYGLAMSLDGMHYMQKHFTKLDRNPTDVVLKIWAGLTSEHCFHLSYNSLTKIKGASMDPYLKIAGIKGRGIDSLIKTCVLRANEKINAPYFLHTGNSGIVDAGDGKHAYSMRIETHNHPSQIEPFGGAATGTGGDIRDILADGGIITAVGDVLFFGPMDFPWGKLPLGTKHPSYIQDGVVAGIGAYGNNMGLPNISGAVHYDESYTGNVLVFCSAFGYMPLERVGNFDMRPGDKVILAGGRTGADGLGGVTFASSELTEDSEVLSRPAVQVPNPIEKEKLRRAWYEVFDQKLITSSNDLGGGGIACPACETVHKFNLGTEIYLGRAPLKEIGLPPWIIATSESQERMYMTTRPENVERALQIFEDENVEATVIGKIIPEHQARFYYDGLLVADLDLDIMLGQQQIIRIAEWVPQLFDDPHIDDDTDLTKDLLAVMSSPNVASKREIVQTYDSEVQGNTITKHFQGKWRKEGPADGVVIKPGYDIYDMNWNGMVASVGTHPRYCKIHPYRGALSCVDEAIRNNVAAGGRRWAASINTAGGNPENPQTWGEMVMMSLGAYKGALTFKTPYISGKDSLYNESPLGPVNPTMVITAMGIIPDVRKCMTMNAKRTRSPLYIVGLTKPELGGSEYYWVKDRSALGNNVPGVDKNARTIMNTTVKAIDNGLVLACHDLSDGGLGAAAAEMVFAGDVGADIYLENIPQRGVEKNFQALFSQSNTRFLVEVRESRKYDFEHMMKRHKISHALLGMTRRDKGFTVYGVDGKEVVKTDIDSLRNAWNTPVMGYRGSG